MASGADGGDEADAAVRRTRRASTRRITRICPCSTATERFNASVESELTRRVSELEGGDTGGTRVACVEVGVQAYLSKILVGSA